MRQNWSRGVYLPTENLGDDNELGERTPASHVGEGG
jgi:hypothetical protein